MFIETERQRAAPQFLAMNGCSSLPALDRLSIHDVFLSPESSEDEGVRFEDLIIRKVRVRKGAELYHAGAELEYLYYVRFGSFKTSLVSAEGHYLVTGFTMSSEVVGLEAITCERHVCSAFALEDSEVSLIPCLRLEQLSLAFPSLQQNLSRLRSREIARGHQMLLMLGNFNAEERLAIFVLDLSKRFALRGYSAHRFLLRMSREDIASSIGLRAETVCRAIARLRELKLMNVQGRIVEITDMRELEHFCQRC